MPLTAKIPKEHTLSSIYGKDLIDTIRGLVAGTAASCVISDWRRVSYSPHIYLENIAVRVGNVCRKPPFATKKGRACYHLSALAKRHLCFLFSKVL